MMIQIFLAHIYTLWHYKKKLLFKQEELSYFIYFIKKIHKSNNDCYKFYMKYETIINF